MQQTSEAYKTEQKQHLREKSYVWVYLGVVDRTAQKTAQITSNVTEWSKLPTGNDLIEGVYATYEQNFFRADGEMMFPPETWAMYQGAASADLIDPNVQNSAAITFTFDSNCDIRGLTLKFYDDAIPLEFTVTNGKVAGTHSYVYDPDDVDEHGNWWCESEFMDSDYITIIPTRLKGGTQRFRIQRILFGVGFYFSDKDLLSTSFTNTVSHLSDKLPSKTFSFTIDNTSRKFSADDPHSFVHFLQEQQEVDFDYGRELPDGTIETIKGGKTYLKTWTTDEQKATFTSVGYIEFMDSTYYKGQIYPVYYTLYDIAEMVFQDAGITNYSIDECLLEHLAHNPLPVEKHKNLLQLIANAGRCIFYEDRDGTFTIAPSLEGSESHNVGYRLDYSDLLSTPSVGTTEFVKNVVCQYYSYELSSDYSQVGSVEEDEVKIGENFLLFSKPMWITNAYYENTPVTETLDTQNIGDLPGQEWIEIIVNKEGIVSHGWEERESELPYFGMYDNFTITLFSDNTVLKEETGESEVRLYYKCPYPYDPEYEESMPNVWYRIQTATNAQATITEKGAYYIKFTTDRSKKIIFKGKEVTIQTSEVSLSENIRNIGVDKTCKNALISNQTWAESNRDWMADYYDDDVEYSLEYRGEPALDCDDQIYLENNYVAKNLIRITDGTINTGQGMSKSTLRARRLSYHEYAKVDAAQVDIGEIK